MKNLEKQQIKLLPKTLRPLSTLAYAFYTLLFALGPIGLVATFVCAVSAKNINLRRYARSLILISAVMCAVTVVLFVLGILNMDTIKKYAEDLIPAQQENAEQILAMISACV